MEDTFLEALAKPEVVPGGGAAAAHGAVLGLALLEKIVRVEGQRQRDGSEANAKWGDLLEEVRTSAKVFLQLREEDGAAYLRFAEARNSGDGEREVIAALEEAIECPMKIMEAAQHCLSSVSQVGKHCKGHLLSDLLVVCDLLQAANLGAYRIAQANLLVMADYSRKGEYQRRLSRLRERSSEAFQQTEKGIMSRQMAASSRQPRQ
ncbi:MAG: cyclodeaminase/cyclohydrolase family protein [Syntrophobacterales bacterium]|jgi:formiminotetrahydrofolate cyclodeaminase